MVLNYCFGMLQVKKETRTKFSFLVELCITPEENVENVLGKISCEQKQEYSVEFFKR